MVQPESPKTSRRPVRRTVSRVVAACGITLASLAVTAPSWAGPLSGC